MYYYASRGSFLWLLLTDIYGDSGRVSVLLLFPWLCHRRWRYTYTSLHLIRSKSWFSIFWKNLDFLKNLISLCFLFLAQNLILWGDIEQLAFSERINLITWSTLKKRSLPHNAEDSSASFLRKAKHRRSPCGPRSCGRSITWELVRNADPNSPQT